MEDAYPCVDSGSTSARSVVTGTSKCYRLSFAMNSNKMLKVGCYRRSRQCSTRETIRYIEGGQRGTYTPAGRTI
jgi:hypothetical protein